MRLELKVTARASADEVAGWSEQTLKVRVRAAPEKGRANHAVEKLLADALAVPRASVRIVSGHASTRKIVEIDQIELVEVKRRLDRG
ncbi:MAG TPA: DUF167 domain-containing protein [Polyangiaceae bacterium]